MAETPQDLIAQIRREPPDKIELTSTTTESGSFQKYVIWRHENILYSQVDRIQVKRSGKEILHPGKTYSHNFPSIDALLEEAERKLKIRMKQGYLPNNRPLEVKREVILLSLETQIALFKKCGIEMSANFSIAKLLKVTNREDLEACPYIELIHSLSTPPDRPSRKYRSPQLWSLDQECIYEKGDYTRQLTEFIRITNGDLILQDVKESFQPEMGIVTLTFAISDQQFHYIFKLNDDWLDPHFFDMLDEIERRLKVQKYWYSLAPDHEVLAWLSPEHALKLEQAAKLEFTRLFV